MTRPPLELLADYIEASRERDAAEAAIRSGATGCSDFVRAVTRELDAREALMQLDPAALRARVDIEADGMRAGLDGHAGTHNPYIWKGAPEHRDAWSRGQQAVEKFGRDRYQMGYEKAQEVAAVTAESALRVQADVMAERDSLLSGLREAVQVWTQKRDSNRRDGDRRGEIIYSAVVSRALDILNDQETDEHAQAQAGAAGSEGQGEGA